MFQVTVDGPWKPMDLLKRGQNRFSVMMPSILGNDFLPIKAAKKKDVVELLQYVEEQIRNTAFFESLVTSEDVSDQMDEFEA